MKDKRIKILQIVEGFGWGGAEKKLLELVKAMDKKYYNTIICSLGLTKHIQQEFDNAGFKVITLPRKGKIDLGLVFKLANLMKREKIDIIMTTLFYADFLGPLAAKIAGVKAIISWETVSSPEWLVWRRLLGYRFANKFCNKVVAVSEATKNFLIQERGVPENKVEVIKYGVDLNKYNIIGDKNPRELIGLNVEDKVIGMVGRLNSQKGHIYLINAARDIVKFYPDVKFVIVGEGILKNELIDQVKAYNLKRNFLFLGYRKDVNYILGAFDIFVLPSLYEGLPNAILEAMAVGKPVVATAVDGTTEIIEDGKTGLLIPPKDPSQLKNALLKLLSNKTMAAEMGLNGRKRVEKIFSLERQVDEFQNLFNSLANDNIQ